MAQVGSEVCAAPNGALDEINARLESTMAEFQSVLNRQTNALDLVAGPVEHGPTTEDRSSAKISGGNKLGTIDEHLGNLNRLCAHLRMETERLEQL